MRKARSAERNRASACRVHTPPHCSRHRKREAYIAPPPARTAGRLLSSDNIPLYNPVFVYRLKITSLRLRIFLRWGIKTMSVNARINDAHTVRRKIRHTFRTVGIEIKQTVSNGRTGISRKNPIRDLVMNLFRIHIIHVLRVVDPIDGSLQAGELVRLLHNRPDIAALADSEKFAVWNGRTVFNNRAYGIHSGIPFAARLTFYQSCQQFSVAVRHTPRFFPLRRDSHHTM